MTSKKQARHTLLLDTQDNLAQQELPEVITLFFAADDYQILKDFLLQTIIAARLNKHHNACFYRNMNNSAVFDQVLVHEDAASRPHAF